LLSALFVTCGTHPLTVITVHALGSIRSICCWCVLMFEMFVCLCFSVCWCVRCLCVCFCVRCLCWCVKWPREGLIVMSVQRPNKLTSWRI
jgi:hypothetical protein